MKMETDHHIVLPEMLTLVLCGLVFTAVNVAYSIQYGRLSIPPTYDDIGYISNGLTLLESGYRHGWGQWLLDLLTKTWHAPLAALQACLAFALWGKQLWGPYLLNGLYAIALLILLRKELQTLAISIFLAVALAILAWPLAGHLIVEFRPDIATNLFLALGGWRLAKRHEEIAQGTYRSLRSTWKISWPFLVALWLKPSFAPVAIGLWLTAWFILSLTNHLVLKSPGAFRHTLASWARCSLLLFVLFLPYLVVGGRHLAGYFGANLFGENREIWSPPLSLGDQLKYYIIGEGGRATMGLWTVATFVAAMFALFIAARARDFRALRLGGLYASFGFVAWAGMTVLSNKSPWFGSLVTAYCLGVFIAASAYIIDRWRGFPRANYFLLALFAILAVSLHAWPKSSGVLPGLDASEIPAYSREARRVFTETCGVIRDQSGENKVVVLMPLISTIVNPDLIELCQFEGGDVSADAPRIYTNQYGHLLQVIGASIEFGELNTLALVLSEDFPGIPGSLPSSRRMGSINHLFASSHEFKTVATIRGPNGTGNIRVLKKTAAFAPIENVRGMKSLEGPYPDKKLPVVRWTLYPAAEFDVPVSRAQRMRLILSGLAATPRINAKLRLSGGEEAQCEFVSGSFRNCQVVFAAQSDHVHVTIEPSSSDPSAPSVVAGHEAILLSRIEVVDLEATVAGIPQKSSLQSKSPFSRIDFLEGFGSVEGPYRKWALPVVIWGRGDASRIGIAGENRDGGMLFIEWRPGVAVQALDVLHKGESIGRCAAGMPSNDFRRCQIDLPNATAPRDLVLRYTGDANLLANKMNNSALFKRIELVDNK